jgi:hypothetical protein
LIRNTVLNAAALVGASERTWLGTSIGGRLDDTPWLNDIALTHPTQSIRKLARLLQVSCCVVIAFLSGMQHSSRQSTDKSAGQTGYI